MTGDATDSTENDAGDSRADDAGDPAVVRDVSTGHYTLEGTILAGRDFEPIEGRVVIEDGEIAAVEAADVESSLLVCPAFVDAHTHVGDAIAKDAGRGLGLEELVAPPDGLKHRLLREADHGELVAGMRRAARTMLATGTAAFVDFREGGHEGVEALREAVDGLSIEAVAMGRGDPDVLEVADGYGASGANDADFAAARNAAAAASKPFAIHAGEADASDINGALDLEPDHLVHMVHPDPLHLARLADDPVPVVVCPRSNLVTGVGLPDVEALEAVTDVALGTDNVFLNAPSMFRELEVLSKACGVEAADALRMATANGAAVAGLDGGYIEAGAPARLLALDGGTDNLSGTTDPVRAVVRRAGSADVAGLYLP